MLACLEVYSVAGFAKGKLCDQSWENKISRRTKWEGQSMIHTLDDSRVHLGIFSLERTNPEKQQSRVCKFCRGKRAALLFCLINHL